MAIKIIKNISPLEIKKPENESATMIKNIRSGRLYKKYKSKVNYRIIPLAQNNEHNRFRK